jgi:alkylation response protein AidB-like acyl-CoA dehydrogenase
MDFELTADQQELAGLARRIFEDRVTPERLAEVEESAEGMDRQLWRSLGEAGLIGIALPEAQGGGGLGLLEQCLVLEEAGRCVAPVPLLASAALAAAPLARFGRPGLQEQWSHVLASGEAIATAALAEPSSWWGSPLRATASRAGAGYRLTGDKTAVPALPLADLVLVPADVEGSPALFAVPTTAEGVTVAAQETTGGSPTGHLSLRDVELAPDARLGDGDDGGEMLRWAGDRALLGACAAQLGVLEQALADTATYTTGRVQFERPVATFQAVGHRLADAYIDVEGVRLTLWQAVWRLEEGLDASTEVAVAKYWAAEAGHRVAHAAVHLHGGMGVARSHTLHRYFLAATQLEFLLGGATEHLLAIGTALAEAR